MWWQWWWHSPWGIYKRNLWGVGPNCSGDSRTCLLASLLLTPPPQSVGTDLGLCGIWMLLICPYVITMTHGTVWVTQTRAWGTSARPVELPTCLDPCLNRDSMTQRQGRVVLHNWLVSSAPGSFGLAAQQLRGRPCSPRQQCPFKGAPHRKGQP